MRGPRSAVAQTTMLATAVTAAALVVSGAVTATLLYAHARVVADAMLIEEVLEEEVRLPEPPPDHPSVHGLEVRLWTAGDDPVVPPSAIREAQAHDEPMLVDAGDRRAALLGVRNPDGAVLIADKPRVTVWRATGPFLAVYAGVASITLFTASVAQALLARRALRPLQDAAARARHATGAPAGIRLAETGPDEVRTLLAALNQLLARLEESALAQSRFTSEAAHELRTPVAAMRGHLEVTLRRPRTEEEYRDTLRVTLADTVRLGELVDGLLALARVDTGQSERGRVHEHAAVLTHRAAARERATLDEAGCALELDSQVDPEVFVQAPLVEAAVANLLRNAARHAPKSRVRLATTRIGDHLAFVVDDDGPGVPPEERETVFARFARGSAARRAGSEGIGLGLAFAREVARRHGGDCVLGESPAGGCRATLTVRLGDAPAELATAPA
ncbi:MAG: sensor histidine kinase [Myxococcota bacterium]